MRRLALMMLLLVLGCAARAGEQSILAGCRDAQGQAVAVREDTTLQRVAVVREENGRPVILTNPAVLPALSEPARTFLYARACVQATAGDIGGEEDAGRAAVLDCAAVEAMHKSGLLQSALEAGAVERALQAADPGWSRLPGPPRNWDLRACYQRATGRIGLPAQLKDDPAWSRCVEACGNALWACQHGALSAEGACMERYRQCSAACDASHP